MIRNGCGQSGLQNEQMEQTNFFAYYCTFKKVMSMIFGRSGEKWALPLTSLDPEICCILKMSLRIELIFLHADYDAIIFGQTNIVPYIFEFKCQSIAVVLFGPPALGKGPMKQGLFVFPPSVLECLGIGSLDF